MFQKKTYVVIFAVIITVVALIAYLSFSHARYNLVISQDQVQQAINKKMPFTKKVVDIITVSITHPTVTLKNHDDHIYVAFDFSAGIQPPFLNHLNVNGQVAVKTQLKYLSDKASLYLTNPEIISLNIDHLPAQYDPLLKDALNKMLTAYCQSHPVYQLKADNFKMSLARAVLKNIEIKDKSIYVQLGL